MKKKLQTTFQNRQYMISKDFELYYYNDTNIGKVKAHAHNYYEFYFFLEGDVSMKIEQQIYSLRTGDIVMIPPGLLHQAMINNDKSPYKRFVFWISKDFLDHLSLQSASYTYFLDYIHSNKSHLFHIKPLSFNTLQSKIIRLLEETRSNHFGKDIQLNLFVSDFILHINRLLYESSSAPKSAEEDSLYSSLVEYIEEHLDESLSLDCLADNFFVSKYHIAHIFKENLGISIHQYITKKRLELCQADICSDKSITKIYRTHGFGDYSSFYRAFKKEFGISPDKYRRQKQRLLKNI